MNMIYQISLTNTQISYNKSCNIPSMPQYDTMKTCTKSPGSSTSILSVRTLPPTPSAASKTSTWSPARRRCRAQTKPATPAPTTLEVMNSGDFVAFVKFFIKFSSNSLNPSHPSNACSFLVTKRRGGEKSTSCLSSVWKNDLFAKDLLLAS